MIVEVTVTNKPHSEEPIRFCVHGKFEDKLIRKCGECPTHRHPYPIRIGKVPVKKYQIDCSYEGPDDLRKCKPSETCCSDRYFKHYMGTKRADPDCDATLVPVRKRRKFDFCCVSCKCHDRREYRERLLGAKPKC